MREHGENIPQAKHISTKHTHFPHRARGGSGGEEEKKRRRTLNMGGILVSMAPYKYIVLFL